MLPNYYIHEHLMVERQQERQREMAELRMVAGLRRHHYPSALRRLAAGVRTLLLAVGKRLKGLVSGGEQVAYEQSNGRETKTNRSAAA